MAALWPALASASGPTPSGPTPSPAAASSPTTVEVIKVEGAIDRPLLRYVESRLAAAEQEHAVVVLQLNTSGTLGQDGVALGNQLVGLRVPVLTWTGSAPAMASGAGLLLMYAASLATVSPGSQTGPLNPVDLTHPDAVPPGLGVTIQGWLAARHRTGVDTTAAATAGIDGQQANEAKIAALGSVVSVPDLLNKADGMTVWTAAGPVTLHTHVATSQADAQNGTVNIRFGNLGLIARVLHGVSSPSMIYFLLVVGLACLAFEITQPGFGFAGFAGIGMLALAVYGLTVVPVNWLGLLLIVGGVGLMVLDVRIRNLGVLTGIGLLAFAAGSWLAWRGLAEPMQISPWLVGGAIVASLLYYGFGLTVALQSRDRIVTAQRGLIGLVGEARGKLAPDGPVYVKGAVWRGRTEGESIAQGAKVRVRGVDGLVLKVEAEPAGGEDVGT